jgi:protein tyrosine/serine phosphatase
MAETYDLTLNLEKIREVQAENNTVAKTNGINYFSNPIEQVQKKEKIETFAKIMDNSDNYSVLIYRQHGTERAEIYSALYRTE